MKARTHQYLDAGKSKFIHPAVGFRSNLDGYLAPVVVKIPDSFFRLASTNPDDIAQLQNLQQMGKA
ncbi:hypothetical protein [Leucobacter salsicius]|uniref:hypothetical protein n=1 Tax=Leucobacter salsicius TaxID=664638 RepID=UPI00037945BB|nr:hypothetical protein [Leucobacter salsicius]